MVSFTVTLSNVLLTLMYLLPGFALCKFGKVKHEHLSSLSVILLYICGFCLYVNALYDLEPTPELFTKMGLFLLNLAEIHHNGQELADNCALLTTLLSVVTIPLLSLLL